MDSSSKYSPKMKVLAKLVVLNKEIGVFLRTRDGEVTLVPLTTALR